jgi:hypothetical protein
VSFVEVEDPRANRGTERVLSIEQRVQLKELCDMGDDFVSLCRHTGNTRELSLAITKMEEAVHWASAHFTREP